MPSLPDDDARARVALDGHVTRPGGHRRVGPTKKPLPILRPHDDTAPRARGAAIVVPIGRVDRRSGAAEKNRPANTGKIVAAHPVAARHVARDHLAPRPVVADRSVPAKPALLVDGVARGDPGVVDLYARLDGREILSLEIDVDVLLFHSRGDHLDLLSLDHPEGLAGRIHPDSVLVVNPVP